MREIKFRAWIPDIERMYSVNSIEVNPNDNQSFSRLVVWEHPCERSAKIKGKLGAFRLTDEIPIMQYTGLKDKNGVEIYEGDILQPCLYVKTAWAKCVVIFENGMFCFELNKPFITSKSPLYDSIKRANSARNAY